MTPATAIADTFTAIEERRSVKVYDPEHRMTDAEIERLMSLAMLSPTSFNIQNWRFVVVVDPDLRQQLKQAAWNQAQVTDASILVLVCADLKAWDKDPARYWHNAPEAAQNAILPMIGNSYRNNSQLERDEAIRSVGIASQTLMLAAKAMGYDSCPMIGFDPNAVGNVINLPEDHIVGLMLPIGKALQPARPRSGQLDYNEVVFTDRFPA